MVDILRKSILTADFFTHSYRISGQVDTRGKRLIEILNDHLTSFIELHKTFVSRLSKPSEIAATYSTSALRKDGILFVISATHDQDISERPTYSLFSQRRYNVFLTVPSFEIKGQLESTSKLELSTLLARGGGFISLNKAAVQTAFPPQISFSGELVLVNKAWIELFCLSEVKT